MFYPKDLQRDFVSVLPTRGIFLSSCGVPIDSLSDIMPDTVKLIVTRRSAASRSLFHGAIKWLREWSAIS